MFLKRFSIIAILVLLVAGAGLGAEEKKPDKKQPVKPSNELAAPPPLAPVKTESPRDTLRSFMKSMIEYQAKKKKNEQTAVGSLNDAARTMDLSEIPAINRQESAREAALLLKEVLDRVIVIDYSKIPEEGSEFVQNTPRWRLKDTEIVISRQAEGERAGEWLFSAQTVARTREFYEKVRDLPYLKGTTGGAGYQEPWENTAFPMPRWMREAFLGLFIWQWLGLLFAIFLGFTMRSLFSGIGSLILKMARKTQTDWDDKLVEALVSPIALLAASGIWLLAVKFLGFRGSTQTVINVALQVMISFCLIWVFYRTVGVLMEYIKSRATRSDSRLDDQLVKLISSSLKTFVIVFGVLLAAQNLGVEIFSLLAGLGIGGLAVALAAKDTLANFFGSIMIMLDKPFQVGHWVIIGNIEGTVEEIGFRTTRIRTFYNSLISVPNSNIATTGVDNLGVRTYRRIKTSLDITYDTPPEKMEAFVEGIKDIINAHPHTRKDYFHVVFNEFAESSLRIMLYFFLIVPDWSVELVERQNIFLDILRLAEQLGVRFAFPTRTLHVESSVEQLKGLESGI